MDVTAVQAAVVVDELVRAGVVELVLAPGSRSAPLVLAAHRHPRLRVHVRIDERSAAFCALGLARASGRPTAALCTSGTAAANFHPAVVEADTAGLPLVAVTADRPPELRHAGANQTIDQQHLYGSAARAFGEFPVAEAAAAPDVTAQARTWRSELGRVVAAARGSAGRPGPVHLNVPLREPLVASEDAAANAPPGRADARPWTAVPPASGQASDEVVAELARALAGVQRGVIVAGEGTVPAARGIPPASWPQEPATGGAAVGDLAERLGWPVLAEPTSRARGVAAAVDCPDTVVAAERFAAQQRPDVVVRLGRAVLTRPLHRWLCEVDAHHVVVAAGGAWDDPLRLADRIVAADPDRLCGALAHRLEGLTFDPDALERAWLDAWLRAGAAARAAIDAELDANDDVTEPRLARDLLAAVPRGSAVVAGSSRPVRDVHEYAAGRDDVVVVGNRGASGIDGFTSTAAGVALGTERPTVALTGDLALLHDLPGLVFAGSAVPDLVVVVVDNDGGGIFEQLPTGELATGELERFTTPVGVDLAGAAAALGAGTTTIERAGDLPDALAAARRRGGVQLVRAVTDRRASAEQHRRLRAAAAHAVERAG